jgi:UDP-N-acetylglucosamine 4,6-dehydratase
MIDRIDDCSFLEGKSLLITGGTGSLGNKLVSLLLRHAKLRRIIIFSRDEFKQFTMAEQLRNSEHAAAAEQTLRYFLGDIRDRDRLYRAFNGVDFIIHAAALKQVPAAEYNPFEFVKTNVLGSQNVMDAAIDAGVKRVMAISTDKAANPVNLYGATKLCLEKVFVSGNAYAGHADARFAIARYGNVVGSRGSVIPFFMERRKTGALPITHADMTRFWITLDQAASFVINALRVMHGGEIFIPKIPSMRIVDLARLIGPDCKHEIIGIRPGEKLHEMMVEPEIGHHTLDAKTHYVIQPLLSFWNPTMNGYAKVPRCAAGFTYTSGANDQWVGAEEMKRMIRDLNLPGAEDLYRQWEQPARREMAAVH